MKFSSKSEYGVRVMTDLARHFGHGPISLTEVAREEDLPLAYLEHVVAPLRKAGLVTSRYGARGGYELSRPPVEITMAEIVRVLEGPITPMVCATELPAESRTEFCSREEFCSTKTMWMRVRDSIADALTAMTLADLLPVEMQCTTTEGYSSLVSLPVIPCPERQIVKEATPK